MLSRTFSRLSCNILKCRTLKYLNCNKYLISTLQSSMECNLTEDELAYQEMANQFMESKLKPNALLWDEKHFCDVNVLKEAASLGFGGLYISPELGGTGLNRHDTTLIFEQLSQGCVSHTALLTIHNMSTWMLAEFGNDTLRNKYLDKLLSCELIASYCLTESHSGSDAASLKTSCKIDNNNIIINGEKSFISGGGSNDLYIVMTRTSSHKTNGITCVAIPGDVPGISFGNKERKMGWNASPTSIVYFDNVIIDKSHIIGNEGDGFKIAMKGLDGGRLNIAACSLGAANRCLEIAMNYSNERKQFNTRIIDFQHTQFKLSSLFTLLHSSRLMLRNSSKLLDNNDNNKTMYCAMAKKYVTDNCFKICNDSLQILGGYGYISEYEIERFVRDCRVHQILEGTNEIMDVIISRRILDDFIN